MERSPVEIVQRQIYINVVVLEIVNNVVGFTFVDAEKKGIFGGIHWQRKGKN